LIGVKVDTPSIKRLRDLFGMTEVVNDAITKRWMAAIREQFHQRGGRFSSTKWPAYSRLTLYSKRVRAQKGRMLEKLYGQIKTRYGKTFAMVYSDSEILSYHHFGTKGPYKIPKEWTPGKFIAFPHPEGRKSTDMAKGVLSRMKFGKWAIVGHPVNHPGLKQRQIFPTIEQAEEVERQVVEDQIRKKILEIAIRRAARLK